MTIKCPNCGYEGKPKLFTKGSFVLEVILWLMMLIPGLIYSLWRVSTKYKGCPKCSFNYVIKQ